MTFRVVVDWDVCQDHAQCVLSAPEVFGIGDDRGLELVTEQPDDALREACEEAADFCPTRAIRVAG